MDVTKQPVSDIVLSVLPILILDHEAPYCRQLIYSPPPLLWTPYITPLQREPYSSLESSVIWLICAGLRAYSTSSALLF